MKREFLEGLGLEKDVIDQIMAENGKDINREKNRADNVQTQLDEAKNTLKGFEGVNVEELSGKVTTAELDESGKVKDWDALLDGLQKQFPAQFEGSGSRKIEEHKLPDSDKDSIREHALPFHLMQQVSPNRLHVLVFLQQGSGDL